MVVTLESLHINASYSPDTGEALLQLVSLLPDPDLSQIRSSPLNCNPMQTGSDTHISL